MCVVELTHLTVPEPNTTTRMIYLTVNTYWLSIYQRIGTIDLISRQEVTNNCNHHSGP